MHLYSKVPLTPLPRRIDHESKILLLGSCFSQHMGSKLQYFGFQSLINPSGILYHPVAIEQLLTRSSDERLYTEQDLIYHNKRWRSLEAHTSLSHVDQKQVLLLLNAAVQDTRAYLFTATHIYITLGTSWVYRHLARDIIVANCHKLPAQQFEKSLLSVDEVRSSISRIVKVIKEISNQVQIVFTISPVRHFRDGIIANQRSKAHLISGLHSILEDYNGRSAGYFPSYELFMDELRDYRYVDKDLVHPNELAINYIWQKYLESSISPTAAPVMKEIDELKKGLAHRPFYPDSSDYNLFREKLIEKGKQIQKRFPHIRFDQYTEQCAQGKNN